MTRLEPLTHLEPGMKLLVGGTHVVTVPEQLAERFRPGDSLAVMEATGEILHIPSEQQRIAKDAVTRAQAAFVAMHAVTDAQIASFFSGFADRLADPDVWKAILDVNQKDVEAAKRRGRSTTRLVASESLRKGMIDGLRGWISAKSQRGQVLERVEHTGWSAELLGAELGVVGFVFEGRPNVVADATGVLRGGNTVVFRIGRDALGTAKAIVQLAAEPALEAAGMPQGAITLIDSAEHAAGWALFSDRRLSLAVARGSGPAVATLGRLAQNAGIPVSLHGTGGAWLVASPAANAATLEEAVFASLDRKVCNTLNVCCIPKSASAQLLPAFLQGLSRAGERRGQAFKLHVVEEDRALVPNSFFTNEISVERADGPHEEPQAEPLPEAELGREWEWEETPEVSLKFVDDLDHAISLFNRYSPHFVACLVSPVTEEHEHFYGGVDAPFVGDGFTRWVDGQYALRRPELGLSNWQNGRLFGRGGVLSGDSVYTVRTRVRGTARSSS